MFKVIQRFGLTFIAGFMTLVLLIPTVFSSYGQYEDPPEGYWEDVVTRVAPPGDGGGMGCYTPIILSCVWGIQRVHCQFNGVYGEPFNCEWTRCFIGGGSRHCVRGK